MDENTVMYLNFLAKSCDSLTKVIVATKNREHQLNPESLPGSNEIVKSLESSKNKLKTKILNELKYWPLWTQWIEGVPGIGPVIGANLILLHYYKFTPVCKQCGQPVVKQDSTLYCPVCNKSIKGDGTLSYKMSDRYFHNISAWWHFMGVHCNEDGNKPKRVKGVVCDWSPHGRKIAFAIGECFKRTKSSKYREFYDMRKSLRTETHPDASLLHRDRMACNETAKFFLAHLFQVARIIAGNPLPLPYSGKLLGMETVDPYYYARE